MDRTRETAVSQLMKGPLLALEHSGGAKADMLPLNAAMANRAREHRRANLDMLPLPTAMAVLAEESREAARTARIEGVLSLLVPLALALARLAAERDARNSAHKVTQAPELEPHSSHE